MTNNKIVSSIGAASAVMAFAMMSSAHAQTAAQPQASGAGGDVIQDIVVTAQFREESLQRAPLAITAVDRALMEARSQNNVEAVAQRAPSVSFSAGGQGGGAQTASVMIRGIGATDFQFPNDPGVGVYIDDVYYGISVGAAFDLVDLDRIEILRGPQGTLAGKNSIGGAIKLFSRKPGPDSDAYIEGTYGSLNRLNLRGATNFTLVDDKLYARITGLARHVDGYVKRLDYGCVTGVKAPGGAQTVPSENCVIGTEGGQEIYALRAALRWMVSDRIENNIIVDFTEDRSEASASKLLHMPLVDGRNYLTGPKSYTNFATYTGHPDTPDQFTVPGISHLQSFGVSNTLDAEISDSVAVKSITAYRFARALSAWDGDVSPEDLSTNYVGFRHRQFTQEVRLSAKLGEWLDATVGGYYYRGRSRQDGRVDVGVAALDFTYDDPYRQDSESAFLHMAAHLGPKFNLTGGLRFTHESKNYAFHRSSPIIGVPTDFRVASLDGLVGNFSGSRWDYRFAADYELARDVRIYAQVATGFKGGGINPRPFLASQVVPYQQEQSTSYEIGLKSILLERKLRLNVAYFHNDYKGYQGQVSSCPDISPPGFPFCSATRNVGDARIDGVEMEFDARPFEGASVDASVSYTDFRFVSAAVGSGITPGQTKAPFVPAWKYAIGTQYEAGLGEHGSLTPRIDWIWQSSFETNIPNGIPGYTLGDVDARGLLNLRLTYKSPSRDWEAAIAVTNATDKFYYVNKFDRVSQSNTAYGQPGRPREIMFSIKRSF